MARVAKYADVWHPTGLGPEELARTGDELDAMAGRKIRRTIRLSHDEPRSTDDWIALLSRYRDAGCDEAAIDFGGLDEALAQPAAIDRILDDARALALRRGELV